VRASRRALERFFSREHRWVPMGAKFTIALLSLSSTRVISELFKGMQSWT
jgi:hypothetical protein